jgi:hypothetical protein
MISVFPVLISSSNSARNEIQERPDPVGSDDELEDFNIFNSDGEDDADILEYDVLESFEA